MSPSIGCRFEPQVLAPCIARKGPLEKSVFHIYTRSHYQIENNKDYLMHVTLSVIIPVFNGAKFIAKTVQTALDQTYENYEVIVVNDGSTDETLAKLTPFLDSIRVISIPNGGVSNARNTGILASIGEYWRVCRIS
jgi:cellulose synthase/poly-beta-1,6-N-acetylglucosamine synthase-like glycosyltransferase